MTKQTARSKPQVKLYKGLVFNQVQDLLAGKVSKCFTNG